MLDFHHRLKLVGRVTITVLQKD